MESYTITLLTTYKELNENYVIYNLRDAQTAALIYVGTCKQSQVMTIPDARSNPLFASTFKENTKFILNVTHVLPDRASAMECYAAQIKFWGMPEMIRAHSLAKGVQCLNTGEIFASIKDAAQAHGLDQAALSRHLRGIAGHRTVKGKMYCRV